MRRQILMCFLLLASLLVQGTVVFACASMNGSVQSHRCLDMRALACGAQHDCDLAQESASGPCCDSDLARCWVAADMAAGTDHTLTPDPLRLSAPPPAATLIVQPTADRHPSRYPKFDSAGFAGTDTYLITRRLRD